MMQNLENQLRSELASQASDVSAPLVPEPGYLATIRRKRRTRHAITASTGVAFSLFVGLVVAAAVDSDPGSVEIATADAGPQSRKDPGAVDDAPTTNADEERAVEAVNALVSRHPDVFLGYDGVLDEAGSLREIFAVIGRGHDFATWEGKVRRAGGQFPTRLTQCDVTAEELRAGVDRLTGWSAQRSRRAPHIAFGLDPATCSIEMRGKLTAGEQAEVRNLAETSVTFIDEDATEYEYGSTR